MTFDATAVIPLFFLVAVLYSAVGHAGASGYLAVMALMGFAPEHMRPTALALNLLVGGIGLVRFHRAQLVPWKNVLPFVVASVPCAYFAAQWQIPKQTYSFFLAIILVISAIGAWQSGVQLQRIGETKHVKPIPVFSALCLGALIGCLSGITGTGGAIFLTPLLLYFVWAHTREASGLSVAFVWLNSLAGLIGLLHNKQTLPDALPYWLLAVACGALLGTQLGIQQWPTHRLRKCLSVVLAIAAIKLLLV